jgi:hypothetical protein
VPPQPSDPQALPLQAGTQVLTHWPLALQAWLAGQVPQVPPQPSAPQAFPVQAGVQGVPFGRQVPLTRSQLCEGGQTTFWQVMSTACAETKSVPVVPEVAIPS